MENIFNQHFKYLQQEVKVKTSELSAICEILDLTATHFDGNHQKTNTDIMDIILRHTTADILVFTTWGQTEYGDKAPNLSTIVLTAAGAPEIPTTQLEQVFLLEKQCSPSEPEQIGNYFFIVLPLMAEKQLLGSLYLGHQKKEFFSTARLRFLSLLQKELSNIFLLFAKQEKLLLEQKQKTQLKQFFPPEIIKEIFVQKDLLPNFKILPATILFADLRGFSALTERCKTEQIASLLNYFYQKMSAIIFSQYGTLERFVGDGLLALFGAPVQRTDDSWRALRTAILMQQQWQPEIKATNLPSPITNQTIPLAIGIHSGEVVAGFLGTKTLLTYTAIGDPVNTCHRITSIAGKNQIIVSESTLKLLEKSSDKEQVKSLLTPFRTAQKFRGMQKTINLYQVCQTTK